MVRKSGHLIKRIFTNLGISNLKIIDCSGLFLIKDYIANSNLIPLMDSILVDNRNQYRIWYLKSELMYSIIFRILNGETRISHCMNTSIGFFKEIFKINKIPDFRTLVYYLNRNPHTNKYLSTFLFRMNQSYLKKQIQEKKITRITIDIDQTAQEVHGKQEGSAKGYSPHGKNLQLYQGVVWVIRELKLLFHIELRPGNKHSISEFQERLARVIEELKPLGVKIRIICDSGYENKEIFDYLHENGVKFLFAIKQRKSVKKRGKNSKNKKSIFEKGRITSELKERIFVGEKGYKYREVFVRNYVHWDEDGVMYFKDFKPSEFTNVYITNMELTTRNIYKEYKKHAKVETVIQELKSDFDFGKSHHHSMRYNEAMTLLIGISYNIKNMYCLDLISKNKEDKIMQLKTFRKQIIHIPGILVSNSGRKVLKLNYEHFSRLKNLFSKMGYTILSKSIATV
ncbi:MAG: IS1380 family transposase [Leptospira sp.]|nr:IS1380 family transposase [Leptospira sp.]